MSESRGGCEPFTRARLLHVLPFEMLRLLWRCRERHSDPWPRQQALGHAGVIASLKCYGLANILHREPDARRVAFRHLFQNDDVYLDGLRWHPRIGSLLQIGRQVLIHVLKDQSEFGFSVSPRDRAYVKQPGNRGRRMREG